MKQIIAIDGHAASGKSTQAKRIAKALGYTYIDSGSMYRALTYYFIKNNMLVDPINIKSIIKNLKNIVFDFKTAGNSQVILLNGKNVEPYIRNMDVSENVSKIAAIPEIRTFLVKIQREVSENLNIVMDGRDIGTVVFPHANKKFFLKASDSIRARRRFDELKKVDKNIKFSKVLENIISRDFEDTSRSTSPLKPANDAIIIDTSTYNETQVFNKLISIIKG